MPLSQLGVELVLGLGAALFGANLWVVLRPVAARWRGQRKVPRPTSMGRVYFNLVVGALMTAWALATLLSR
jgi:hypothetical protein